MLSGVKMFEINGLNYITTEELQYDGIIIPKGFEFDGVTVKAPFTLLFSNKDLRQGIRASCFHDWLCQHKSDYTREYSTNVLVDIWRQDGLNYWKSVFVKVSVNVYQYFVGGWKNESGKD